MSRPDSSGSSERIAELEEIDREGLSLGSWSVSREADENRTGRAEAAELLRTCEERNFPRMFNS